MKRRVVITGMGVVSPIGIGVEAFWDSLKNGRSGVALLTFFDTTDYPSNIAPGEIAIRWGFTGPNYAVSSACATSNNAIGDAFRLIRYGDADVIVSGGSEAAITALGYAGFCSARTLSTRNDAPEKASRP